MALLSMPPERNTPSGTSLISRSADRLLEQLAEARGRLAASDGPAADPRALPRPARPSTADRARAPCSKHERVTRQQLVDALEQRLRAGEIPRGQQFRQPVLVRAGLDEPAREDRLDLRGEEQAVAGTRPVERLDAEPIAGEQQPPRRRVPDREREHAAEAVDAVVAPLLVGVDDRLGVATACGSGARRPRAPAGRRRGCRSRR